MDKNENNTKSVEEINRILLEKSVINILVEKGFKKADSKCVGILCEMMQSSITQLGWSARRFCEVAGRITPLLGDYQMALMNGGIPVQGIEKFIRRKERTIINMPLQASQQQQHNLLKVGSKLTPPAYVPAHMPDLPDAHSFIRTPTYKQPVTEYEAIREKAATQKRNIENALMRFLTKSTPNCDRLFETEDNQFLLLEAKPHFPPYMSALYPCDQVFDFDELEYHYLLRTRTDDGNTKDENEENDSENEEENEKPNDDKDKIEIKPNSSTNKAILENPNIDNPYLRAATLPKKLHNFPHLPNVRG